VQTLFEQLVPDNGRHQKKLLKMLNRIRRRAGRIRDIDVQLAALRSLKVAQEPRRKTQLVQSLLGVRAQHEEKLAKLLRKGDIQELQKKLRRAAKAIDLNSLRDPLTVAKQILNAAIPADGPVSEETLHQCRLAIKRARYAAEFSTNTAQTRRFISELQRLQDVLGNWHDWMTLTDTAVQHFGEVNQSSLVAALHSVTRGKFRNAVEAISHLHPKKAPAVSEAGVDASRKTRTRGTPVAGRAASAA
jgi:CHAD domain-containing protein